MINLKRYNLQRDLLIGKAKHLYTRKSRALYYGEECTVKFNVFKTSKFRKIEIDLISFNTELINYLEKYGKQETGTVFTRENMLKALELSELDKTDFDLKYVKVKYIFFVPVNFDLDYYKIYENYIQLRDSSSVVNVLTNLNF